MCKSGEVAVAAILSLEHNLCNAPFYMDPTLLYLSSDAVVTLITSQNVGDETSGCSCSYCH